MSENMNHPEISEMSARVEVENFVTKVWEHPLLDEQTIEHRQKGIEAMNRMLEENGLKEAFALLTGSSIWITDENSDWDCIVYQKNPDTSVPIENADPKLNVIDRRVAQTSAIYDFGRYFDLLITPDEYIAGNVALARQVRFLIVNKLVIDGQLEEGWRGKQNQGHLDSYFRDKIRGWFHVYSEFAPDKIPERKKRVQKNLEKRAHLAKMPIEKYYEEFNKALNEIKPPEINTYWEAVQHTDGAVHIDTCKSAQNIATLSKE